MSLEPRSLRQKLQSLVPGLLSNERLRAFEQSAGVGLSGLEQVAIAGYAYSTLVVARTSADFANAALRFERRLSLEATRQQVADRVLVMGLRNEMPVAFASLDPWTAAWVEGDPTPAKAAILLAGKYLRHSPKALSGEALRLLPDKCHTGDFRALIAGPLDNAVAEENGLQSKLLSQLLAMSIGASLSGETLKLRACLVGDWGHEGVETVKQLIDTLGQSRFARLLELEQSERDAIYTSEADLVEVQLELHAPRVLTRLHAIVNLDLHELALSPRPGALDHANKADPSPTGVVYVPGTAPTLTPRDGAR